jgi:hypothetical protein
LRKQKPKSFTGSVAGITIPARETSIIEKDTVKYAIGIPEEVFERALNEFVDPGAHDCVEVEIPTRRLRLGTSGLRFCEAGTNPFYVAE